ncbi:hypothetical protein APED_25185 [Acanthopleuribacter pedis]
MGVGAVSVQGLMRRGVNDSVKINPNTYFRVTLKKLQAIHHGQTPSFIKRSQKLSEQDRALHKGTCIVNKEGDKHKHWPNISQQ